MDSLKDRIARVIGFERRRLIWQATGAVGCDLDKMLADAAIAEVARWLREHAAQNAVCVELADELEGKP